jgi:hypothetical protein
VSVEAAGLAREDGPQVEAKAVDVHLLDPVAQAVGDHLDDARVRQVQRVARAGVVDVVAALGQQAIVGGVVHALEGERRPELVALGGVVVDHVEDHLQARVVEARHHLLEFLQAARGIGGVAGVGREKTDAVVAPVVGEALLQQVAVVDEGVHRQELDRRDAKRLHVLDDFLHREAGEGAAQLGRNGGMPHGVAAHVRLVDHGAVPRDGLPGALARPVEVGVHHHRLRHERGAVLLVERQVALRVADPVAEHRRVPLQAADVGARVRVEEQLVGVEAVALGGRVGAVHAVAVHRARTDARDAAVPYLVAVFGQLDALDFGPALAVEQAHLDLGGMRGEHREVDALPVPRGTARMRQAFADACFPGAGGEGRGGCVHEVVPGKASSLRPARFAPRRHRWSLGTMPLQLPGFKIPSQGWKRRSRQYDSMFL